MAPDKPAIADGFAARLSLFYGAHFLVLGMSMPFFPLWLAAKGLDAGAIGIVLAAPMIARMATTPLLTGVADRFDALRGTLMAAAMALPLGYALVGLSAGFWPILVMVALVSAMFGSIFPLSDAYALKGVAIRGGAYGPIRLWGSAAFIVGNLGAGLVADQIRPVDLIWLIAATSCLVAVVALALRPIGAAASARSAPGSALAFLRSPAFLVMTAAVSLIQSSHAVFYGFSALGWAAAGLDGRVIGLLWGLMVSVEIVLFAYSGRLPPWLGPIPLVGLGAAGAVVRWTVMALDPPVAVLPFVQVLHGLSFACTHLGSVFFVARAAPAGLGATAQGYFTLALSLVMAGFMAASGWLFQAYGARAYMAMAVAAAAGGLLVIAAHRLWRDAGSGGE
jgi:PPP family 3-phenylpropionic acid transporter